MAQINAGILQPIDFVGRVQQGFQQGQQQRRQADMDAALQALAANPQDPKALQMFRRADPMKAMQFEQSQQDRALKEIEASRENILKGAQIIRQLNPRDDASWRQALSIASQMGMNISQVPQNFDPQYVQSIVAIADALEPQGGNQGFTLGEGQVRYDRSGNVVAKGPDKRPRYYPVPQGGKLVLEPGSGGGPQPGTVEDGYIFRGGDPADQNNWVPVNGGPTPPASGSFRP